MSNFIKKLIKGITLLIVSTCPIYGQTTVSVFCGGDAHYPEKLKEETYNLGKWIGERNWDLLSGGGPSGLMKSIADGYENTDRGDAVHKGVLLTAYAKNGEANDPSLSATQTVWVETHRNRLEYMQTHSDIWIVLPGGFCTLYELMDCLVCNKDLKKSVCIINDSGYWDHILTHFENLIENNPSSSKNLKTLTIFNSIEECINFLSEITIICND